MANANVIELEVCMGESISWCQANPDVEIAGYYLPRLQSASQKMQTAVQASDSYFLVWRKEEIDDKLAWKRLSNELRATQAELGRTNVLNFPNEKLRYWDTEELEAACERMLAFLDERGHAIGTELYEKLERSLASARTEAENVEAAFLEYRKQASARSNALGLMASTLYDFRGSMRGHLGKSNADYLSIRWPFSLNPDRTIL